MAKFPTYEEMSKKVAEKALDEFLYDGKSIREWMQIIASEDAISRQAAIDTIESWLSCDDYNEAERHIMRAMQSVLYDLPPVNPQPKTGWIPVSERLPEDCRSVLVYCPTNDNIFCAYIERGEWKIFSPIASEKIKEVVTAWMPLPEPYKAEGGE